MIRLVFLAALVVACGNPNYVVVTGQVVKVERGDVCYVTVQDPDPIVVNGTSRFEVTCDATEGLNPGDRWPRS